MEVTLRMDSKGHLQALASKMSQQGSKDATYVCTSLRVCICVRMHVCLGIRCACAASRELSQPMLPGAPCNRMCTITDVQNMYTDSPVPILIMSAGVINL